MSLSFAASPMPPRDRAAFRAALGLVLGTHVLLVLSWAASIPAWEAPDEPAHYRRVRSLACSWGLVRGASQECSEETVLGDAGTWEIGIGGKHPPRCEAEPARRHLFRRGDFWHREFLLQSYQQFQPPLGHLVRAPWYALTGPPRPPIFVGPDDGAAGPAVFLHDLDRDPAMEPGIRRLRALRSFGAILGALTLLGIWRCGRAVAPDRPGVALAATSLAAFLPQFTFVAAYVNNDGLAAAAGAWLTAGLLTRLCSPARISAGWLAGNAALLVLAVGSRPNAAGLAVLVLLALWTVILRRRGRRAAVLASVGLAVVLLAAAGILRGLFPEFWRTWVAHFQVRMLGGAMATPWETAAGMARSLVGVFGWMNVPLATAAYLAAGAFAMLLASSLAVQWTRRSGTIAACGRGVVALLVVAVLAVGIPSFLNALSMGQAQGRYLLPAAAALAILGGLGACGSLAPRRGFQAAAALSALLVAANLAALVGVLRPAYGGGSAPLLTRMETPAGPLLVQHGPARAGSPGAGFAPGADGRWILAAPEGHPFRATMEARLSGLRNQNLLEAAVKGPAPEAPARIPGVATVESRGPGRSAASRVRPGWLSVGSDRRRALLTHPTSRIELEPVSVPQQARLRAQIAIHEDAWDQPGDGVTFRLLARLPDGEEALLGERYLDPKRNVEDRQWTEWSLDLGSLGGRTVTFVLEALPGPDGNHAHDWAGWAGLWLDAPSAPLPLSLCDTVSGALRDPAALKVELPPGGALTLRLLPAEIPEADLRLTLRALEPRPTGVE
jgi:hypothetical protein